MRDLLLNPNIVYLILIGGLWISVTAVYIPGTGIVEIFAFALLALGILALTASATNWFAVLLLFAGVMGFLVMPFIKQRWANLAVLGLVFQILGGLFLFQNKSVSWLIIAFTIGLSLVYHRFALMPILEAQRRKGVVNEDDLLIGAAGRVIKALDPVGTVNVRGELWTAHSDKPLEANTDVVVLEREGLQLYVEALKHKRAPQIEDNHREEIL